MQQCKQARSMSDACKQHMWRCRQVQTRRSLIFKKGKRTSEICGSVSSRAGERDPAHALMKRRSVSIDTRSAAESVVWNAIRLQDVRSTGSCGTDRHMRRL